MWRHQVIVRGTAQWTVLKVVGWDADNNCRFPQGWQSTTATPQSGQDSAHKQRTSAQGLAQRDLAHALGIGGQLRVQEGELQGGEAH